eukprot:7872197-Heterocapsa_arctica.AAC.1
MTTGFKDTETSIQAEHDYVKDKFHHMEQDILGVRHLVKDLNKRKSNEMDEDKAESEAPESEDKETMTGA